MSRRTTILTYITWVIFTIIGIGIIALPSLTRRFGAIMGDETKEPKKIDCAKLYGHWLIVSMHNTGDTLMSHYYKDTLDLTHCCSILSINLVDEWSQLQGDLGVGGRYKIDTLNNKLLLLNINRKEDDTVSVSQILYLSKRCMLLQADSNKKVTQFYLRTDKEMIGTGG